ncbi:hypothetical protein H6P81_002519 [Aristolochia fimbriata]|uniref:VOC domain-containing protein n=1 Tax=Aristolochia fimbriata TaxID=158543 RepID=A0AAV7FDU2_ARIFI|nr:hypothetical protein H6P81_002519 [Aristolochia fimbriata]
MGGEGREKESSMEPQEEEEEAKRPKPKDEGKKEEKGAEEAPPLMALNHVSRLCKSVQASIDFYVKVLGFVLMERPQALDHFNGAWLFNYGVGIHLVQKEDLDEAPNHHLDPMDNHISFQCEDMEAIERKLKEMNIRYMKRTIEDEKGTTIDQLFFNDPDGFMVEICNCENLKLAPAGSPDRLKLPGDRHNPPVESNDNSNTSWEGDELIIRGVCGMV